MDSSSRPGGAVFCTNCGYKLTGEDRFCPECGAARPVAPVAAVPPPAPASPPSYSPSAGYGMPVAGMPFMATTTYGNVRANEGELIFDTDYPERLSRLLIFVKWLLIIPHLIVLSFVGIALLFTTILALFAILFTGKYPRGLWDFGIGVLRWQSNVNAYSYLQRDEYPPFSTSAGEYPVTFEMDYPERLSRWKIFVKWLLIIPSAIVYYILTLILGLIVFLAWFAILFTGRFPKGLFDFTTGTMRWGNRLAAYSLLLTDVYPPFRMDQ